jgi:nucleotide-binding universal stress UspA family protein
MAYKSILTIFSDPETAPALLETAIALSHNQGAHLIGLHAETPQYAVIYAPMDVPDTQTILELAKLAKERSDALETMFIARTGKEDLVSEWRRVSLSAGFTGHGVIDTARCSDLILCGQIEDRLNGPFRNDLEALLFESGRPVLFIPSQYTLEKPIERVIVAWNGSREAARAVFDAMGFLEAAKDVEILSIDSEDDSNIAASMAGAAFAATLARHKIAVTTKHIESRGEKFATIIQNRLIETKADLLVMGAYTHSRLSERVFGGVTNTLMRAMPTPTLMSR